jgi:ArsR family transcriptional regulator
MLFQQSALASQALLYIVLFRYKVRFIAIKRYMNIMDIDDLIKAIANPVRRDILAWLREPEKHFIQQDHPLEIGVCAGLIDQKTGLSQSTVSAHLATLQRAGLVTTRRVGQWVFYKRNEDVIKAFVEQLGREL